MATTDTVALPEGFVLDAPPQLPSGFVLDEPNAGFSATFEDTGETLYDEDLQQDPNFVKASKVIYEMNESIDADKLTDEEYAKYGIEQMGWFNYNLPSMTLDAAKISGSTEEQKKAFLYMMESYDELGISWNGASRFF